MLTPPLVRWGVVVLPALAAGIASVLAPRRDRVVVLLACVAFGLHASLYWPFTVDDAFITFRFARSWMDGLGPVFQSGPRIEGVTSLGWTALLALAGAAGVPIEVAAKLMGVLAGAAALPATHAIALRLTGRARFAAAATLMLALSPMFACWSVAGMETPLFAALVAWGACARLEGRRLLGVPLDALLLGLSVWIRPEGVLVGALVWLALVAERRPGTPRAALVWAVTAIAASLPFWLARWNWYGAFVPNTFYAKMPHLAQRLHAGGRSLLEFASEMGPWTWIPLAASLVRLRKPEAPERLAWLLLASFAGYVAWSGGDVLHLRFFVHMLPLCAALWAAGIATLLAPWLGAPHPVPARPLRRGAAAAGQPRQPVPAGSRMALAALLVAAACASGAARYARALESHAQFGPGYVVNNARNVQEVSLPLGEWLRVHAPANAQLATWDIGGIGWASRLPILDLYGLTDRTIARLIHSGAPLDRRIEYVMAARPELIVTYARTDGPVWSWLEPAADSIEANYQLHSLWQAKTGGYWLVLLKRNDIELPPLAEAESPPAAPR